MARREKKRINPRFVALCLAAVFAISAGGFGIWQLLHPGVPGKNVKAPDYVTEDLLTENPWSRPGTELKKISGVVIHYVGNPGTSAEANRSYFESLKDRTEDIYASAHFIVGLEGEVIQCIPMTEWAYASNQRNEDTLSIEVCHPDDTGEFSPVTYDRLVELTAWLCDTFDLTTADVIRHYDVSGKDCPKYYVENEDAWQQLLEDVNNAIAALKEARANEKS